MIEHAWTVVCGGSWIDQDTGNINLQVIDQINLNGPPEQSNGRLVVPLPIHIVSFWYRRNAAAPESGRATIRLVHGSGASLAEIGIDVALDRNMRTRTRHLLPDLPIAGPGLHEFVVTFQQDGSEREVARIPIGIRLMTGEAS